MKATRVWFEDEKLFILTDDNQTLFQSLLWYPALRSASHEERLMFHLSEEGIHWKNLDEDVSFESFLYENNTPEGVAGVFRSNPELNVSAIARGLKMKQSLLAAYISGLKKPSTEREEAILSFIRRLGERLVKVSLK